ncbi:MAG: glycoside hydrolase family 3 N-terminal domain-containing protein [Campylobacterota bacterium]|nr:glycoside hydrolase family 3 N-terminal domain-containing protein [Campylobacterota bacterium]
MKTFLLLITFVLTLNATTIDDNALKKMIGRMLVVGFDSEKIDENSQIVQDMIEYSLGGVILFDRDYKDRNRTKNVSSPAQLKKLTSDLQKFTNKPLFISVDQEGGKVARLKPKYGFSKIPSAHKVSSMNLKDAQNIYKTQSKMLQNAGINMNFAPVVDLNINPKNRVIVGLERSFGSDVSKVVAFSKTIIEEQRVHGVISVLKHFPGHGSSLGDSHKGFVDVSETWSKKELEPYKILIDKNQVEMIMTAHVFNSHIDDKYPATLSHKFNTKLLRHEMGYDGLIISDDLQMGAISKHYSLEERTALAINAGVDILLFGNQLEDVSVKELVNAIFKQVKSGKISQERIKESNARIENLHTRHSIIQKPIIFTDKRMDLTKEYIKGHYGLDVKDITIEPKTIVLHWTAVMDLEKSFQRLNAELLFSDRADIAKASALNVSAHFLVDRDGTIYQLMPDNWMARHVIGLNYSSIGVENVGGEANAKEDLTQAQLDANIRLVKYLQAKYPSIENVIGHHEYREYENTPLWLEKDAGYRTEKADPGDKFMNNVRDALDK